MYKMTQERPSKLKIESPDADDGELDANVLSGHFIKKEKKDEGICRVCLKDGTIPIFGSDSSILDNLKTVTGLSVISDDPYPKFLCKVCNMYLQGAVLLKKTALKSDIYLKSCTRRLSNNDQVKINYSQNNIPYHFKNVTISKVKAEKQSYNQSNQDKHSEDTSIFPSNTESTKPKKVVIRERIIIKNLKLLTKLVTTKPRPLKKNNIDGSLKYENLNVTIINSTEDFLKQKHFKLRHGKSLYCKKCDISFSSVDEFNKHRLTENHDNIKRKCPICNKTYGIQYFKRHMGLHNNDSPFMCDICGKRFQTRDVLVVHHQIHSYDLPFKCTVCPYRGRSRQGLKIHMRSHTGERPYQCTQCPSRFVHKSNLIKHSLIHKSERDFKCELCSRGFYTQKDLELHHKVVHIGVKDHVCKICGKEFGYRKILRRHEVQVHKREKLRGGKTPVYLKADVLNQQQEGT